jgi:hypothetical protein
MGVIQDIRLSIRELWRRPIFTLRRGADARDRNWRQHGRLHGRQRPRFQGFRSQCQAGSWAGCSRRPGGDEAGYASLAEFERFKDGTRGALDLAAEGRSTLAWRHDGLTETVWVLWVTPNYFAMVDVRPLIGRADAGRGVDGVPSVVIGERFLAPQAQCRTSVRRCA